MKNRIQVSKLRLVINTMLHTMLSDGIRGTCGTINGSSVEFCSWASIRSRPETIIYTTFVFIYIYVFCCWYQNYNTYLIFFSPIKEVLNTNGN